MAGIGFELKKLFSEKSASGYLKAYTYTAVVTTGPFVLLTGMILITQLMFSFFGASYMEKEIYVLSIVYPFIFSQILSSGFTMVITRYLADLLYSGKYEEIAPSLYGVIALALMFGSIPAIWFFWDSPLDIYMKFLTYSFYMLMTVIWLECVYLSALKDYVKILKAYFYGMLLSVTLAFCAFYFKPLPILYGVMLGMNIGGLVICLLLFAGIEKFFNHNNLKNFRFLVGFETNTKLFFINLFYTVSIYIPNIIIWQGTMGINVLDTYKYSPVYDVATFYAFLSILPVAVIFVVATEVNFYEKYAVYFTYITGKGNYQEIVEARKDMLFVLWSEIRNVFELQLVVAMVFIALGNYIMPKVGLTGELLSMYNIIVLAAYCTSLLQIITVLLLYFEDQSGTLYVTGLFLLTNVLFHLAGEFFFGDVSYAFAFFCSAFLVLCFSILRIQYFTNRLDYFIFCSQPLLRKKINGLMVRIVRRLYPEEEQPHKVIVKDI
jgi:uncharacterized membrane protein